MLLAASIVVLLVASSADDSVAASVKVAARAVLGDDGRVELIAVGSDPADAESAERAKDFDGVIELSWTADGSSARLHCYLSRERRWVDRDISFGAPMDGTERDAAERGRLLGFAAASMFADLVEPAAKPSAPAPASAPTSAPPATLPPAEVGERRAVELHRRAIEFAGAAAIGLGGDGSGLGAMAGLRWRPAGPWWARLFVAGRTGTIPEAQATSARRSWEPGSRSRPWTARRPRGSSAPGSTPSRGSWRSHTSPKTTPSPMFAVVGCPAATPCSKGGCG